MSDNSFPEYFNCDNIIITPTIHFYFKYEDADIVQLIKMLCTQGVYDLGIKLHKLPCYFLFKGKLLKHVKSMILPYFYDATYLCKEAKKRSMWKKQDLLSH